MWPDGQVCADRLVVQQRPDPIDQFVARSELGDLRSDLEQIPEPGGLLVDAGDAGSRDLERLVRMRLS